MKGVYEARVASGGGVTHRIYVVATTLNRALTAARKASKKEGFRAPRVQAIEWLGWAHG